MSQPSVLEELGSRPVYMNEVWHSPKGKAIREIIYGATDGLVTSLGFVIGVFGALQDNRIILVTGIAEVCAGAFSMGFSAYISSKSEREFFLAEIEREREEMKEMPDREREEVRKIYQAKGFFGAELDMVVNRITSNPTVWLRTMVEEELGLIVSTFDTPWVVGLITASSYMAAAFLPIIPYALLPRTEAFFWSLIGSVLVLFGLGAGKTRLTRCSPLKSGFEMLFIGLLAALVGYGIGRLAGLI